MPKEELIHTQTVARFTEMMGNILLQNVFSIVHWQKNLLREASLATLVSWIKVFLKDQLVIKVLCQLTLLPWQLNKTDTSAFL